jgi:hypothetical protein
MEFTIHMIRQTETRQDKRNSRHDRLSWVGSIVRTQRVELI